MENNQNQSRRTFLKNVSIGAGVVDLTAIAVQCSKEKTGYNHFVANIMARTAYQTDKKITFDDVKQEVVVG